MGTNGVNNEVVVWEFQDDANFWIPYDADVSGQIEKAHRKNLTVLYLRDVDPSLAQYSIHLTGTFHQLRHDTGTKRLVRSSNYAYYSCPGQGITWQWLGDRSVSDWCSFSVPIQQEIENAFHNHNLNVQGSDQINLEQFKLQLPYIINFSTMTQTRKISNKQRPVRRNFGKPYLPSLNSAHSSQSALPNSQQTTYNLRSQGTAAVAHATGSPISQLGATGFLGSSGVTNSVNQPSSSSSYGSSIGTKLRSLFGSRSGQPSNSTTSSSVQAQPSTSKPKNSRGGSGRQILSRKGSDGYSIVENGYPTQTSSPIDVLNSCTKIVQTPENEDCSICLEKLTSDSGYVADTTVVSLLKCKHTFHRACLEEMTKNVSVDSCVQCPTCKTIHGVKIGNQPPGSMKYKVMQTSLAGYEDCNTITIIYSMSSGIQGPEHPSPGHVYNASGFPRVCFLPDNEKGNKVLRLLCVAWQRRLIFTVGTSMTTGRTDSITWNEIHHKTEVPHNYSGHGYPDANYLDNVLLELAAHGVTEDDA